MRPVNFIIALWLGVFMSIASAYAQCPPNIGFEDGTFTNWQCYTGSDRRADSTGVVTITPSAPIAGLHSLLKNTSPQILDVYGHFPINCPNGSGYSV